MSFKLGKTNIFELQSRKTTLSWRPLYTIPCGFKEFPLHTYDIEIKHVPCCVALAITFHHLSMLSTSVTKNVFGAVDGSNLWDCTVLDHIFRYSLVNWHSYRKSPSLSSEKQLSFSAIFNSYVKLPVGNSLMMSRPHSNQWPLSRLVLSGSRSTKPTGRVRGSAPLRKSPFRRTHLERCLKHRAGWGGAWCRLCTIFRCLFVMPTYANYLKLKKTTWDHHETW